MVGEWVRIPTGNLQKEIRLPRVLAWEGRHRVRSAVKLHQRKRKSEKHAWKQLFWAV